MNTSERILVYARPWNLGQMEFLAQEVWGNEAALEITSEHQAVDRSGLVKTFEKAFRTGTSNPAPKLLSEAEVADIILRCRLLRNVENSLAMRLLIAMEAAVDDVLSRVHPTSMLSLTIDSYVIDLFATLCGKRGIPFIGIVPSMIKDHFRITARGEYVECRSVTEEEIDWALGTLIVKDYRPDFLVKSEREMRAQKRRLWLRNLPKPLWFALLRLKPGEKRNYHYWASQIISQQYWSLWPRSMAGIDSAALKVLAEDGRPNFIYLPLQMSPEATIDYWSHDTRWIDYEDFILELIRKYRSKWLFAIKEHPNLLGYRSRGFYKKLQAEPNCVLIAPEVPSNDIVSICQGVLVCTGTAGFEAALRGKPVLSDSEPYYASPGTLLPIDTLDGDLQSQELDTGRRRALMAHVLRGTLHGRFLNNGTWTAENPEHREWGVAMGASIRSYINWEGRRSLENRPSPESQDVSST